MRSFDSGGFAACAQDDKAPGGFAACAQDDKSGEAARMPTEEDPPSLQVFATSEILRLRALRALCSG